MIFLTHVPGRKLHRNSIRRVLAAASILFCAVLLTSCGLLGLGMLKLQFGCVPEGTRIDTPSGPVSIENLKTGDTISGFNGSQVRISQIHQYLEDPATSRYVTVHFSNGSSVSVSGRHRIDGTPAGMLKAGDTCGSHTVTGIGTLNGISRSFDLLTGDPGYRIGGIPVNSMIEEMLGR